MLLPGFTEFLGPPSSGYLVLMALSTSARGRYRVLPSFRADPAARTEFPARPFAFVYRVFFLILPRFSNEPPARGHMTCVAGGKLLCHIGRLFFLPSFSFVKYRVSPIFLIASPKKKNEGKRIGPTRSKGSASYKLDVGHQLLIGWL